MCVVKIWIPVVWAGRLNEGIHGELKRCQLLKVVITAIAKGDFAVELGHYHFTTQNAREFSSYFNRMGWEGGIGKRSGHHTGERIM